MIVYIAGPMAGLPEQNFPAFHRAARQLRDLGHEVLSPAEGIPPETVARAVKYGLSFVETPEYAALLKRDLEMVDRAHIVALLPGWQNSNGVKLETARARETGKRIVLVDDLYTPARLERLPGRHPTADIAPQAIKWTGDPECEPRRSYAGDAGYDLVVSEHRHIAYGAFVDVPCGINIELPPGVWALVTGRSSTLRDRKLLVAQGIIDNGWRGPIFAGCQNLGPTGVEVRRGERVAQLIPFGLVSASLAWDPVAELGPGDRGHRGFGSTGL